MSALTRSSFPPSHQMENLHLHAPAKSSSSALFRVPCIFKAKHGFSFSVINQGLTLFNINRRQRTIRMDLNAFDNLSSGVPPVSSGSPFPGWLSWMLLTILPIMLPFIKNKWGPLMAFKKQVQTAIETVECIAEVVEDVAEEVDKIADEVAEKLPDGSKLKEAICAIDNVAEGIIKSADLTEDLIHKVNEMEKQVEKEIENSANVPKSP